MQFSDFGRRVFLALQDLEKRELAFISLKEIGERVARAVDRDAPYTIGAVRNWLYGGEPDSHLGKAIARVLGVSFIWLASGKEQREALPRSRTSTERSGGLSGPSDPASGATAGSSRRTPSQMRRKRGS